MATPPADRDEGGAFAKRRPHKTPDPRPASRGRPNHAYDEDEARRGSFVLACFLLAVLAVGAWLIFSGLL